MIYGEDPIQLNGKDVQNRNAYKKENAKRADIGSTVNNKDREDYDSNAWIFETANAAKIALKVINPFGRIRLIQDIARYF